MTARFFVDTNVAIYTLDRNLVRWGVALAMIKVDPTQPDPTRNTA
jgi:hypothetical protein